MPPRDYSSSIVFVAVYLRLRVAAGRGKSVGAGRFAAGIAEIYDLLQQAEPERSAERNRNGSQNPARQSGENVGSEKLGVLRFGQFDLGRVA